MRRNAPHFWAVIGTVLISLSLPLQVLAQAASGASASSSIAARLVSYSGRVPDRSASASGNICGITFAIYRDGDGGAPLWLETQNVTLDEGGHYEVLLGSTTSGLPVDLFPSDEPRWLGVKVQGQPEQPRVLLTSVPYSVRAMEADRLSGHPATEFVTTEALQSAVRQQLQQQGIAASAVTSSGLSNQLGQPISQAASPSSATNFNDDTTNQVVSVQQSGTGISLKADAPSNSAIVGTSNAKMPSGVVAAVAGISSLDGSFGVYGRATSVSTSKPGIGVYGQSDSPAGVGLEGIARGTGNTIGLVAQATSTAGFAINATETATSGNTVGVAAQIYSPTGIGALIMNNATGPITGALISARTANGVQFTVDGSGSVTAQGGVNASGTVRASRLISTVATGTAPLQVTSTTLVPNLNAGFLGGKAASAFALTSGSPGYIQNGSTRQTGANFNIDGNGTLGGSLAANSVNTASMVVAGPISISGIGHGLTFPDGTTQQTASPVTLGSNTFTGAQKAPTLLSDTATIIGSTPGTNGQVAIMPDNLDTVHQYWQQAGQNMHFRLSSAQPGPGGTKDFIIAPYTYGMAIEYAGVLEAWVDDFSVHTNHRFQPISTPARFWVGDEGDTGGLFVTAFHNGGTNSYTVLASDRFTHTSHGPLVFQVRDPADTYKFQWGPYNSEVTRASFSNTATATNLNLMYGSVQGTVTADSNNNGAINMGSVSATPVNLFVGNTPKLTLFPDGNVSIGNVQDSARLSVGSTGLFRVGDAGDVTAASLTLTGSLTLAGSFIAKNMNTTGTVTMDTVNAGTVTANSVTSAVISTPAMNAASVTSTSTSTGTLDVGNATANSLAAKSLIVGNGTPIVQHISVTTLVGFAVIPANSCSTQLAGVSGATDGDTVALGIPSALGAVDGLTWFAWVSSTDTVSIRGCNATLAATLNLPPASIRLDVWKH